MKEKTYKFRVVNNIFAVRKDGNRSSREEIIFPLKINSPVNFLVSVAQEGRTKFAFRFLISNDLQNSVTKYYDQTYENEFIASLNKKVINQFSKFIRFFFFLFLLSYEFCSDVFMLIIRKAYLDIFVNILDLRRTKKKRLLCQT